MLPLLLKPRLFAARNRWTRTLRSPHLLGRDLAAGVLSLLLIGATYNGTYRTLESLSAQSHILYISPSEPLAILFLSLIAILLFSGTVASLGSLFYSRDLELLQASPISRHTLFTGKFLESLLNSSWLIILFSLPVLLAFGTYYGAQWGFYLSGIIFGVCLAVTVGALAFSIALLCSTILSAHRLRDIVLVSFLFCIAAVYWYLRANSDGLQALSTQNELLQISTLSAFPKSYWLPSLWLAEGLSAQLRPDFSFDSLPYWGALFSLTVAALSLAYLAFITLYEHAHARLQHTRKPLFVRKRRRAIQMGKIFPKNFQAVFGKEAKLFARDVTQAVQLVLLLALCLVYLYNFQLFHQLDSVDTAARPWFEHFLIISNILLGGFVTLAVCARFVFPAIALEGKSLWIFLSSPLPLLQFLQLKFFSWYLFVACMSVVIFCSGGLAIQLPPSEILALGVLAILIAASLCSLAIGFGAAFAEFDWDNPSQITASLGNFLYIIAAGALILLQNIPIGFFLVLDTLAILEPEQEYDSSFSFLATALLLLYVNLVVTRWGLHFGARNLERSLNSRIGQL